MCPAKLTVYTKMVTGHKVHPCVAAGTRAKQSSFESTNPYILLSFRFLPYLLGVECLK